MFGFLTQRNAIDPYVEQFKQAMEDEGAPVRIAEVRRSKERQRNLYAQGRTAPGAIVTWTLNSKHVLGRAFDFDFVNSFDQEDDAAWELAGEVGRGLGLVWLPDRGVPDYRHLELPD
jgi:peptidoglycan L-alanyl-D-glutamate endopeptidase CwlK